MAQEDGGNDALPLGAILKEIVDITDKDCGIGSINLYSDKEGKQPLSSPAVKLNQATQTLDIQTGRSGSVEGFVSVSTLGNVESNLVPFGLAVCQSPLLRVKKVAIQNLVKKVYELNEGDG